MTKTQKPQLPKVPEPITRTHVHLGNPAHRATYQGPVGGSHVWRCSCGDTVFTMDHPRQFPG